MTASASAALAEPTPMGIPLVDRKLVKAWFTGTLFWVVVGPVLGLIASMKLDDPYFLANIEWLQFARLRIAHVNGVIFGLFSTAVFGFMCYAVPKLTGRPLALPRLAWWGMALFQVGVVVGETCLLMGYVQPVEAGEYPLPIDLTATLAFLCVTVPFFVTIAQRRHQHLYASLWYWVAGMLWTAINLPLGSLVLPKVAGATSAAMHGFYLHNVVGLWITPMGLGAAYYMLPVSAKRPLFSHKLSLIGFWALAFTPVASVAGIAGPALSGHMSNATPDDQQGELQGVIASVQAVAMGLAPMVMTAIFWFFTHDGAPLYLPGAPFLLSAMLMVAGILLLVAPDTDRAPA